MQENINISRGNSKFIELIALHFTSRTLTNLVFFLTLVLCCWTHPRYYDSRVARTFRLPLAFLATTWWMCYPFVFVVKPLETNFRTNLGHYAVCYILFTKSLDWGLFSGPQPRRKFVKEISDSFAGSWQLAEKTTGTTFLDELNTLLGHVVFQLTSMRGLQFPWGHFSEINRNSLKVDLIRYIIFQTYSLVVIGVLVNRENFGSNDEEGKMAGLTCQILGHWKDTLTIITGLCSSFEALQSFLAVLAHCLHPQLIRFGFPDQICEFFDPIYYPPLFGNPLYLNSLAEFWGKIWHQVLRRSFVVHGAFPLAGLAAALRFSPKNQRVLGFVGAFIASGLVHAGPFFFMSDTNTSTGEIGHLEHLAVFLCFFSQALGCLIEERMIGPKWMFIGGKVWTVGFLLCSLPFFSYLATKPGRFVSIFDPVQQWGFFHLITPIITSPLLSFTSC